MAEVCAIQRAREGRSFIRRETDADAALSGSGRDLGDRHLWRRCIRRRYNRPRVAGGHRVYKPRESTACTRKVCTPRLSSVYDCGEEQPANSAPSNEQRKVDPDLSAVKEKLALVSMVLVSGAVSIVVSGGA